MSEWSHELQNPLTKIALQVAAETSEKIEYTSQVLHGDFHAGNVIVDDCGNPTLMDWEELAVGDPRWDIATMLDSLGWDSPAAKHFLEAYQTAIGNRVGHLPTFRGLKLIVAQWVQLQFAGGHALNTSLPRWRELSKDLERSVAEWLADIATRRTSVAVSAPSA